MATRVVNSKIGLQLACNVSEVPVPRPRQVFPIPDLKDAMHAFLALALDNSTAGRQGITATVEGVLPDGGVATWTLYWGISGFDALGSLGAVAGSVITIPNAMPTTVYAFWLSKCDRSGAVTRYPTVTITTPSDYALGSADDVATLLKKFADAEADGKLTEIEKLLYRPLWVSAQAGKADLDASADAVFGASCVQRAAYDAAYTALNAVCTDWTSIGTTDISGRNPTIATRWSTYWTQGSLLRSAIEAKINDTALTLKARMDAAENDGILTELEKPTYRMPWDAIVAEKPDLVAKALAATVSSAAYGASYTALDTIKTDWTSVGQTDISGRNPRPSARFSTYFSERTLLQNAIIAKMQGGLDTLNSDDILSRAKKTDAISDYNQEIQTRAQLQAAALACTPQVSHATYTAAVDALASFLGALSPTWTDISQDTPLGSGGGATLRSRWSTIASTRQALQNSINQAQATKASTDAISAAATDALARANAAQLASQPHQVGWAYAAKPALPSASYPAGYYAITTDSRTVQVNPAGTAWSDVLVAATALVGKLIASQLTVANFDNLVPNANSTITNAPSGSIEARDLINPWAILQASTPIGSGIAPNQTCRYMSWSAGSEINSLYARFDVNPGDEYYAEVYAGQTYTIEAGVALWLRFYRPDGSYTGEFSSNPCLNWWDNAVLLSLSAVAPVGSTYCEVWMWKQKGGTGVSGVLTNRFYCRRKNGSSILVDGAVTARALAATLALLGQIQSRGTSLDGLSGPGAWVPGSAGNAPQGFWIGGLPRTTTYIDGSTDSTCYMELAGSANFGGYRVQTIADRAMNAVSSFGWINATPTLSGVSAGMMCGLAKTFTPKATGRVLITIFGTLRLSAGNNAFTKIAYGTGAAPAFGATETGSVTGFTPQIVSNPATTQYEANMSMTLIVSGLTPGVPIWIDAVLGNGVAGKSASYMYPSVVAIEI